MQIDDIWLQDMPQQFQGKHNIEVLVKAFSKQMQELEKVFRDINTMTDIDTATGKNLDYVGTIIPLTRKEAGELAGIGVAEPVISDERYRQFLRYKSLMNTNECTYYDIMNAMELLWTTDKIRYYEPPDRPATILFVFDSTDINGGDPTEGKITLTLKPAGVAVIYTVEYVCVMNFSAVEKIFLRNVTFRFCIDFFNVRRFDGSWFFDGSVTYDPGSRYGLVLGIKHDLGGNAIQQETRLVSAAFRAKMNTKGSNKARVKHYFGLNFWGLHWFYDGGWNFDGTVLYDNVRRYNAEIGARYRMNIAEPDETVENLTVKTRTRDCWFFDGTVLYDGSRCFNSIYREEAVE